jgi:hypothetical protein
MNNGGFMRHTLEARYLALVEQLKSTGQDQLIKFLVKPEGLNENLTQEEIDQLLAEGRKADKESK